MDTWSLICPVNPQPLIDWYAESCASELVRLGRRGHELPMGLAKTVMAEVLAHTGGRGHAPFLGHSVPGHFAPMHVDPQRPDWLTRVHVPLVTNPGCWMQWEGWERVHFSAGNAYNFNTLTPHSVGNDGDSERVHFIFEVLKG